MQADTLPQQALHTRGGRTITVTPAGHGLVPPDAGRVVLNTADAGRTALTPAEARQLAGLLLQQASAVERVADGREPRVEVPGVGGDVYAVAVRGHVLTVDQPLTDGGTDTGVTPVELLVGSLAACVAHYCGRHLDHHHVPHPGLRVTAEYTTAAAPARVATVDLRLAVPGLPLEYAHSLLAVARFCTVHNTLAQRPVVSVTLEPEH
jgi:uncharacterized OsmC-like protein